MKNKNFVLIDYENVHPTNLDPVGDNCEEVLLFAGHKQTKIPTELASSMQKLGYNARYVLISGGGKNALDFHIAFYAGELAAANPEAYIHIISRDKGFDPLVEHLKERKFRARRFADLWDLPFVDPPAKEPMGEMIKKIVNNLSKRGLSRPRKVTTLTSTLKHHFCTAPGAPSPEDLVKELETRKLISISGNDIKYRQPISKA